jgi:hypothetical protein
VSRGLWNTRNSRYIARRKRAQLPNVMLSDTSVLSSDVYTVGRVGWSETRRQWLFNSALLMILISGTPEASLVKTRMWFWMRFTKNGSLCFRNEEAGLVRRKKEYQGVRGQFEMRFCLPVHQNAIALRRTTLISEFLQTRAGNLALYFGIQETE